MFSSTLHDQPILEVSQGEYIATTAESFLIDRQSREWSKKTIKFYRQFLNQFITYCDADSLKLIQEITPDFLRRYFLVYTENHNPGGVHASYRPIRAFLRWVMEEEIMQPEWKNPMQKVKAPKVHVDPLEPISIEDVRALIDICQHGTVIGPRGRAIFLFLLDTGARAQELCNINIKDVDPDTGSVMICYGKGGKSRMVFIGRKTRRNMRCYLRLRQDQSPALFVSKDGERISYDGLNQILERRTKLADLEKKRLYKAFVVLLLSICFVAEWIFSHCKGLWAIPISRSYAAI